MMLTGTDKLAGWSIWFFLFSVLHAARWMRGDLAVLAEMVLAALLASAAGRVIPVNDDGRRLPPAGSSFIIMLAFVILASAAFAAAFAPRVVAPSR